MSNHICQVAHFLQDVGNHTMTVLRDDGVNRHLHFRKPRPAGSEYWFDIITWRGALCIDGDMGSFVFKRLDDMFEFFRADREYLERKGIQLAINPSYWSEKLVSICRGGFEEFDPDRFRECVKEDFDVAASDKGVSADDRAILWSDIEDEVLKYADDGCIRAVEAAMGYSNQEHEIEFRDFYEHRLTRYTYQFIWCCYAVAWGVKMYDQASTAQCAIAKAEVRQYPIMNQSGRIQFKELEMLVVAHLQKTGYLQPDPALAQDHDKVHVGNMVIDLILLAENMGLDFTECLAAAYSIRTGATK